MAQYIPLGLYAMVSNVRESEKLKALGKRGIILFHKYSSEQDIPDAMAGAPLFKLGKPVDRSGYRKSNQKTLVGTRGWLISKTMWNYQLD